MTLPPAFAQSSCTFLQAARLRFGAVESRRRIRSQISRRRQLLLSSALSSDVELKKGDIHVSQRLHVPVMSAEIESAFTDTSIPIKSFLDCTLGAGGHAKNLLLGNPGIERYIGVDKDATALEISRDTLRDFGQRVEYHHRDFRDVLPLESVDGIMMDLGVSSMQLDTPSRGFSFMKDGPLDMRMNPECAPSAADLVNSYRMEELRDLFRDLADDKYASINAGRIIAWRERNGPFSTTKQLADALCPPGMGRGKTHPATLPFQALRIAVNQEIEALIEVIPQVIELLKPGGKCCILSFHSIEDRIVKNAFKSMEKEGGVDIITRKPLIPTNEETKRNVRARSAKLRIVRKLAPGETPKRFKQNKYRN